MRVGVRVGVEVGVRVGVGVRAGATLFSLGACCHKPLFHGAPRLGSL